MLPKAPALHAVWVVLFAAAGALPALAQDQEDPELARALARRGWFDWANEICDRLEKSSRATADDKATGSFVKAEINLEMAEREIDVEKAKQLCTQAIDLLKEFIKRNAAHALAFDARTNIGWLMGRKARFLKDALDSEQDPTRHAELKKEAIQIYGEVAKFYQAQIDEYKKAKSTDAVLNALMDARLELPRAMLEHAKLVDEKDRRTLLVEAIRQLVDFEFDYGDRPICFEAMLEEGRCLLEMNDFKLAESKLRGTLALKARLAEAKIRPNDYHNKIIYGAYVSLAQMLTRSGKPAEARNLIDQFFKENKGADKEWVGLAMKIEKADALFHLKDQGGAQVLANEVMKLDPNGRFGIAAREKVRQWGSGPGGAIRFNPEQMMTAADSYIDKDAHREAVGALRKAIEGCVTDADKAKWGPGAYYKMGQCLTALKRNYEAAYAYEAVFKLFPKAELAAKACFETARCYSNEFGVSGNKIDDDLKEKYLTILARDYPKDPAARNIPYLQAEKIEATGDLKKAAERYFQVGEDAEAYESALVRSGYCYHVDATTKWAKAPKDPAVQAEVKSELRLAEEALQKFMARLANPSLKPKDADLLKMRQNLSFIANQRLALIYMHDAIGRTGDALKFLEQCAKDIPADDERLAKIWQLQVQAHLAKKELDPAISIVELMFERFPDGAPIAQACKSVAINLDNKTADMIKSKADPKEINDNLKKVSKYYAKWLDEGPSRGLRITMADVVSVAEALYMIAKRINGLDETMISFMDLKGKEVLDKQYFQDAAFVHTLLVEGKVGKLPDQQKILLMTRLARCYSFIARETKEWNDAKDQYEGIVKSYKLIDARGGIDVEVIRKHRELLGVYVEMGYAYYEIGRKGGQKFQLDNASTVFSNLVRVTEPGSEPWWVAKYMVLAILFERGNDTDVKLAKLGVDSLERTNPEYDAGKYGMKDRFVELKKKILQVTGGK